MCGERIAFEQKNSDGLLVREMFAIEPKIDHPKKQSTSVVERLKLRLAVLRKVQMQLP
jgi:hypothetical protein